MPRGWALLWIGLLATALHAPAAEHWRLRYFYDQDNASLTIHDLRFPSPRRGVAVGFLEQRSKQKPVALVSSDGGENWSVVPTPETGLSLFFLNDSLGWMVTPKGIWKTEEGGRGWKKLKSLSGLLRVWFRDEQHGWAVGTRKQAYETSDGGRQWRRIGAAEQPSSTPEFTTYGWIEFNGPAGLITGWSRPGRRREPRFPAWMDPEAAERKPERPALGILLETRDSGQTWSHSVTSMFGRITRVRLAPDGRALGLIEFFDLFEWPSEVYRIDPRTGKSTRAFRRRDRAVTDVALPSSGPGYLAAIEVAGTLRVPIPGKLTILKSDDLVNWAEMPVDYRAAARRASFAAAGAKGLWVATDTGMILELVRE